MATMPREHAWAAEALFRLADWTNSTGDAYFRGLVRGLADVLSVRWVFISRLHPELPGRVQVVAAWADGGPAENIEYDLEHTPCANVMTGTACFYPTGVAAEFPLDHMLADIGVDSYAGTPLRGLDGKAHGLLTVMHDRPMETSRSPCTILDRVAGRAAAELERSRVEALLREADRRKDEFLAMLAHELRNPLAPIRHALAVQERSGDDLHAWRDMRETMERQVKHLVRLVDDLLDVSRLSTGHIGLQHGPVDVREIVADAVETCREMFELKQHQVVTSLPSEALVVEGDSVRLVQVLTNLLNNAAKFTAPGGKVHVVASRCDGMIEICVRDNGAGIAEERLPRIFDLFFQGEDVPYGAHGGLGVGLALARRLIEMHAGTLTASSAGAGRGSQFRITLPASTAIPVSRAPVLARSERGAPDSAALQVLVVDDYVDTTRALERLLRMMGHSVTVSHDGKSAIEIAQILHPDVILLDIELPGMNGYSVARHLRLLPGLVSTRIIALTGYGAESARERVREAGFDMHLVKPVDADELDAALSLARTE